MSSNFRKIICWKKHIIVSHTSGDMFQGKNKKKENGEVESANKLE